MPHEHDDHDHGGHNCIHDHLNERRTQATTLTPQQYGVPLVPRSSAVPRGRSLSAAVSHTFPEAEAPKRRPLRIHVDTSHVDSDPGRACFKSGETVTTTEYGKKARCSYGDVITDAKRELLKKRILPRATDFLEKMLSVHRVDGPLRLGSIACGYEGGVRVPEWMRDKGLDDADFVVFLTMRPIDSPDTVAYGGHCEVDQTGRPIAAHFNWAPAQMITYSNDERTLHYLSRVAMHELTHALVFTPELISYFPADATPPPSKEEGNGYNWDNGYYGTGISYLQAEPGMRAHVATPRVARAVQRHFGCPNLRGAQLEDGGGAGTAVSHWEMRTFRDEYMVGSSSPSSAGTFSSITAALFSDSGWYGVVEGNVEPFYWGFHAGCDFVEKSCREWTRPGYLCKNSGEQSCNYDRRSQAYCEVMSYDPKRIPEHQRHFGKGSTLGGYSPLLDYCPVYRAYSNGDCTTKGAYFNYMPQGGQERCEQCRCFDSTTTTSFRNEPGCYRMRCLNASTLEVHVGAQWRRCPSADGGKIFLSPLKDDSSGSVVCPPAVELCGLDTDLWPVLTSIEPSFGPAAGGIDLTLRGHHLDALEPPIQLLFGTQEGAETAALALTMVNATFATATIPALIGATSHARADVTLTDKMGRTAYLFEGFQYDPGIKPYIETLVIFLLLVCLGCYVMPSLVKAGCKGSAVVREKLVWRQLDPRVVEAKAEQETAAKAAANKKEGGVGGVPIVGGLVDAVVGGVTGVFGVGKSSGSGSAAKPKENKSSELV